MCVGVCVCQCNVLAGNPVTVTHGKTRVLYSKKKYTANTPTDPTKTAHIDSGAKSRIARGRGRLSTPPPPSVAVADGVANGVHGDETPFAVHRNNPGQCMPAAAVAPPFRNRAGARARASLRIQVTCIFRPIPHAHTSTCYARYALGVCVCARECNVCCQMFTHRRVVQFAQLSGSSTTPSGRSGRMCECHISIIRL